MSNPVRERHQWIKSPNWPIAYCAGCQAIRGHREAQDAFIADCAARGWHPERLAQFHDDGPLRGDE